MGLHLRIYLTILAVMALSLGTWIGAAPAAQPATSTTLLRVAFISPTRGVGLFETATGTSPGRCVVYARQTSNGGASFGASGAPLMRSRCGSVQAFSQITFDSAGTLFAYGPRLAVSHDMGRTWRSPAVPGAVAGLTNHGTTSWAIVTGCRATARTCKLTLLRSAGGANWLPAPEQPPDRSVVSAVASGAETGTSSLLSSAPDGAVVLALPDPPRHAQGAFPGTTTVERLQLNATRWAAEPVPCASGGFETELAIAGDGSEWLACTSEPSTGVQPKSLAVSRDGGINWRVVARPCALGTRCTQRMPLGGYLDGLVALSSRTAFYVGYRSALTGTFDGGARWRTWQRIGGGATATLQVTFVDPHAGWAVAWDAYHGSSDLWRTVNGGTSWKRA